MVGNTEVWAETVIRLLRERRLSPDAWEARRERARRHAQAYTWTENANRTMLVYDHLVNRRMIPEARLLDAERVESRMLIIEQAACGYESSWLAREAALPGNEVQKMSTTRMEKQMTLASVATGREKHRTARK